MLTSLGFNAATAQYLVQVEGINTPEAISELDNKMISILCKNCRKHVSPESNFRTRSNPDQPTLTIGVFQQRTLKQVAFYINYKYMTSQKPVFDVITKQSLKKLDGFKRTIKAMENPPVGGSPSSQRADSLNSLMSSLNS